MPVDGPTVAMPGLALDQVPPVGVEFNVVVRLGHIVSVPVIAVGTVFTVTVVVLVQPTVDV